MFLILIILLKAKESSKNCDKYTKDLLKCQKIKGFA